MAKDLNWFKFSPLNWMTGRIRKESTKVQSAFIEIMCQYWKNACSMTVEQAELEIGASLQPLLKKRLVKVDGEKIRIQFLDEQMTSIDQDTEKKRDAAKEMWKKRKEMQVHTDAVQVQKVVKQKHTEKRREEKTRGEREDFYTNAQKAFEDISNNYLETEPQRNILTNKGWRSANKADTDMLLYHFLESQVNFDTQPKSDVKSHFRRWLNAKPIEELQTLSKKIHERFQTEVR